MITNRILIVLIFLAGLFSSCSRVSVSPSANPSGSSVKFYGDHFGNFLSTFNPTIDGGYVFGGYTISSPSSEQQGFIQKCDNKGNVEWYQTYGGPKQDLFWAVHPTSDGGYIAAGATTSYGLGVAQNNQSAYLIKTDGSGNITWQKTYGGPSNNIFYEVSEAPDKSLIAVGSQAGQYYVVKTNPNGDTLWTRTLFKGYVRSFATSVAYDTAGNIAIAGFENRSVDSFEGNPTYSLLTPNGKFLIKYINYNNFGNIYKGYGGALYHSYNINNNAIVPTVINLSNPLFCEKIISRPDGFIYVLNQQGFQSLLLFKIDFNGKLSWSNIYFAKGAVYFNDATNTPDGGLLISGGSYDFIQSDHFKYLWLLNTDANGKKTNESYIPFQENCWAVGAILNGNKIAIAANLTTTSNIHANFFGFLTTDQNGNIK